MTKKELEDYRFLLLEHVSPCLAPSRENWYIFEKQGVLPSAARTMKRCVEKTAKSLG